MSAQYERRWPSQHKVQATIVPEGEMPQTEAIGRNTNRKIRRVGWDASLMPEEFTSILNNNS